jgi:glycosyltransferase involved in cell wall biosynthesis
MGKMKKQKMPFISVLIPAYNNGQFIKEAIDSVLAQEYDNLEIIVVDDGSTDNTQEIVMAYQNTSIQYFHKENSGIASTRNYCLAKARGEYIAWLDSDDFWLPGKLIAQIKYFEEHPDCQIVFTKYRHFEDNENQERTFYDDPKILFWLTSALIKKEVFAKCGGFVENLIIYEDSEMIIRFAISRIDMKHIVNNVYYMRRLHINNTTRTNKGEAMYEHYVLMNLRKNILKKLNN